MDLGVYGHLFMAVLVLFRYLFPSLPFGGDMILSFFFKMENIGDLILSTVFYYSGLYKVPFGGAFWGVLDVF